MRILQFFGLAVAGLGVVRAIMGREPNAADALETAIAVIKAQGAIIVAPVELPTVRAR